MKNTRVVIAVVSFVVTFIFSAGLVRIIFPAPAVEYTFVNRPEYSSRDASEIEYFVAQDNRNGDYSQRILQKSNFEILPTGANFNEYADAVDDYVNISANMDVSRFPADFQDAWFEHQNAWRNYSNFLNDVKVSKNTKNATYTEFRCSDGRYNAEINRSYSKLMQIGRSYGANVY